MAWVCQRCEKKIFAPRANAINFAFKWKYTKTTGELQVDLTNLKNLREDAVVTHLHCPVAEKPGFKQRIKAILKMPEHRDHPLLL